MFSWLAKAGKGVLSFFTGSGGGKAMDLADEAFHTGQEKAELDAKDLASARSMQFSQADYSKMPPFVAIINVIVDAISRVIRPGVTIWVIGGIAGQWELPDSKEVGPEWWAVFWLIITFWFGGRVLLKDLPSAIAAIAKLRGK